MCCSVFLGSDHSGMLSRRVNWCISILNSSEMFGKRWFFSRQPRLDGNSGDHLVQSPCSKQGQLELVSQGCLQSSLQGWRLYSLSGPLAPVLSHSHSRILFLTFMWNFLYFNFCPLPLFLSPSTTKDNLTLSPLLPHQVFG